jgi:hypothetical protein
LVPNRTQRSVVLILQAESLLRIFNYGIEIFKKGSQSPRRAVELRNKKILNNPLVCIKVRSRDSSVGIATGYGLDGRDLIPGKGKIFLLSTPSRPALEPTQLLIQWVTGALSSEVKQPGGEADHSPPSRVVELYVHSPICLYGIVLN